MAAPKAPKTPKLEGTTPCKACGVPLIYALDEWTEKIIPLDMRHHPIYALVIHDGVALAKQVNAYVGHSLTCPKASEVPGEFSGKAKEGSDWKQG